MSGENKDLLDEKKSTESESESIDPVTPEGGKVKNRRGDIKKDAENENDVGTEELNMEEAIEQIFEGQELSEDFKTRTTAIFESAVHAKVSEIKESLEEKFDKKLSEEVETLHETLTERLDNYLSYVAEEWLKENEVQVESNIKVETAESLMNGLKNLISEHSLDITEETKDVVSDLEEKLSEAESSYNKIFNKLTEKDNRIENLERKLVFEKIAEELTDTQRDKLESLVEGLSFKDVDNYIEKVSELKEVHFKENNNTSSKDETEYLEESTDTDSEHTYTDPAIKAYAEAISNRVK